MRMTFEEAEEELKGLAKGRHYSVQFERMHYHNGDTRNQVWLYIGADSAEDCHASGYCGTFDEALSRIKVQMGLEVEQDQPPRMEA